MAEERKRVAPKVVNQTPKVREKVVPIEQPKLEPKKRKKAEPKEEIQEIIPIIEDEPIKPEPKKRRKKPIEPIKVEPIKAKVRPIIKTAPKKIVKKVEVIAPVKKLTPKQIEKQIEREKADTSVPQVAPKKNDNFIMDSTPSIKRSEDKYLRVASNATMEERKLMADKVNKNEVSLSHYAIDGELGFHYYLVIKK